MTIDRTIEILGFIGGALISLSLIPQVIKTYRTEDASDISLCYQCIYIGGCFWVNVYAFYTNLWVIYVPCMIELLLIVVLTLMKVRFDKRLKKGENETSSFSEMNVFPIGFEGCKEENAAPSTSSETPFTSSEKGDTRWHVHLARLRDRFQNENHREERNDPRWHTWHSYDI